MAVVVVGGWFLIATLLLNRPRENLFTYMTQTAVAQYGKLNVGQIGADGRAYLTPNLAAVPADRVTLTAVDPLVFLSPSAAFVPAATRTAEPLRYITPSWEVLPTITEYVRVIPTRFIPTRPASSAGSAGGRTEIIYLTQPARVIVLSPLPAVIQTVVVTSPPHIITATVTPSPSLTPSPEQTIEITHEVSPSPSATSSLDASGTHTPTSDANTITVTPAPSETPQETLPAVTPTITPAVSPTIDFAQPISTDVLPAAVVDAS